MRQLDINIVYAVGCNGHFQENRLIGWLNKICFGNSGRKGKKSEAPAMLNMFPKFALVAIKIYFMVFVNVLRPSTIPWYNTSRSWFNKTISAASFATSTAESTEMPTSSLHAVRVHR